MYDYRNHEICARYQRGVRTDYEWIDALTRRRGEDALSVDAPFMMAAALLVLYHARLLDGERAGGFVKPMIAFLSRENMMITHQGPTTSVTGGIYELDGKCVTER